MNLGIDNISQIKKKAAIAKAEAEKEIAVAKAEADRQANDARINSEREIAKKNNELSLQKSELKKMEDTKKAEAMEKKAEAYQKYNNAAMAEMLIKVLPEIAGKIAEPLTQIDKITIIGGGQADGIGAVADNVPAVMAKLFETMKETVGIDLGEIVKAGTYDPKVNRNINITRLNTEEGKEAVKAVLTAAVAGETQE